MIITEDAYLEHYGVKGMKWGKRKSPSSSDFARKAKKGAVIAASIVVVSGAIGISVVRAKNRQQTNAERAAIKSVLNTAFQAKDAKGNVISKIGSEVTSETIRALMRK